jgi:O-antigen ligase
MKQKTSSFLTTIWNQNLRDWLCCICCAGMFGGMLFSRALLSISMIIFIINALHPESIKFAVAQWRQNLFAKWAVAFVATYLISGFWSEDIAQWLVTWKGKIPFLVLPFAFFSAPFHKIKYRLILTFIIAALLSAAMINSIAALAMHPEYYLAGYQQSHPLPTTVYGDHIRFSLSIVLSMLLCFNILFEPQARPLKPSTKLIIWMYCMLSFVYIHILAAKTGIMALYVMLSIFTLIKVSRYNKWLGIAAVAGIPVLAGIAFFTVPTFKTKLQYVQLEIEQYKRDGRFDYNYSDNGRMITYELALHILQQKPLTGTGTGDLLHEMKAGYDQFYPEVPEKNRLIPHNQFLFTATGTGLILVWPLMFMVLAPLYRQRKLSLYIISNTVVFISALMVEAMLEIQFGVFLYLFFTMLWVNIQQERSATV